MPMAKATSIIFRALRRPRLRVIPLTLFWSGVVRPAALMPTRSMDARINPLNQSETKQGGARLKRPVPGLAMLCGVSALLAFDRAMAADVPERRAASAEFVRICAAHGAGFFALPGSDTCLQV
jgi:hypothetical protein